MRRPDAFRGFVDGLAARGASGLSRRQESAAWAFFAIEHGKTFLLRLLLNCACDSYREFAGTVERRWPAVRLQGPQEQAAIAFFSIPSGVDRAHLLQALARHDGIHALPQLRPDGTALYGTEGGRYLRGAV